MRLLHIVCAHCASYRALTPRCCRVLLPLRSDEIVDVDGTPVSLAPLEVWWLAYGAYRPERAEAIAQTIDRSRCTALLEELELT